jgi:23S rRNA (cytosine1962-C5)-methyltransferase
VEYLPELVKSKARLKEEGGPFDLIILDPPAFTKSRSAVAHAKKGYREINEWAMRLLPSRRIPRDLLMLEVHDKQGFWKRR